MIKKIIATLLSSSIALGMPLNAIGSAEYKTLRANAVYAADNEEKTEKAAKLGDPNADGKIDAVDASLILCNYSRYSTSDDTPTNYELATCDTNNDKRIDAVDASTVLKYYAYSSVGGKIGFEEFLKDPNAVTSDTTTTSIITTTTTTTTSTSSTTKTATTSTSQTSSSTSKATATSTTTKAVTTTSTTTSKAASSTSKSTTASTTTKAATTSSIPVDLDTDKDGLTDVYENALGTDVNKADTDGDGLTDYQEVYVTGTDPLVRDSFTKDVSDADADMDNDGLSNAEEIKLGTEPNESDTDSDDLKDGEEVKTYKTDPLKYDTDGDTISDGDEVKLKTDPTKASSDGKTPDKDRKFVQKLDKDSDVFSSINTDDNPFKVSMEINAAGYAENAMDADESGYSGVISSDMVLGIIPEFKYEEGLSVDDVVLNFDIDSKYTKNTNGKYAAVSKDFEGIKRLNVFKYFEDTNMLLPIETTYDEENNRVSTHVDELGTYCLVDMEKWHENLGITPDEYKAASTENTVKNLPRVLRKFAPDAPQVTNSDELDVVFHVFSKEGDALNKSCSDIKETAEKLFNVYGEKGKVHIIISAYSGALATVDGEQTYASSKEELEKMLENVPGIATNYKTEDMVKFINKYMAALGNNYEEIKRTAGDKYYILIDRAGIESYSNDFPHYYELFSNRFNDVFKPVILSYLIDYKSLAANYEGFFYQKSINFATPVYEFIINSRSHKTPQIITPTGWKELKLDAPITQDYLTEFKNINWNELAGNFDYVDSIKNKYADTDKDGLLDLQEICYCIESNAKGVDSIDLTWDDNRNVILPTFVECMKTKSDLFYIHDYIQKMEQWKINLYGKFRILPIVSDPMSKDGDYDGIDDTKDTVPLSSVIEAVLTTQYSDNEYHGDIHYSLDTRDFFKPADNYKKKFATWGSVLSTVVYTSNDKRTITYDNEKMHADKMLTLHGFQNIEVYDTRDEKDAKAQAYLDKKPNDKIIRTHYPDYHALRMMIGYQNLEYNGQKKTIIAVVLEGTETSPEEWISNFDLGSTEERILVRNWLSSGKSDYVSNQFDEPLKYLLINNPNELDAFEDWTTAEHHKGFDIAATRCKKFIDSYISVYRSKFDSENLSFYVTGHSRAAAVANILSYYLINDKHETFAYTYACPSTTTDNTCKIQGLDPVPDYSSIFNIVNSDDFVPKVPMDSWHFTRYGKTTEVSIRDNNEYKIAWKEIMQNKHIGSKDYTSVDVEPTVYKLSLIALQDDILEDALSLNNDPEYVKSWMKDIKTDDYYRNNCYSYNFNPNFELVYDPDNGQYHFDPYITAKFQLWSKISKIPNNALPFCLINSKKNEVCQTPAFFMQILAAYCSNSLDGGKYDLALGIDIADRYWAAKMSIIKINLPVIGGMSHPHYLQSYYILSQNIENIK